MPQEFQSRRLEGRVALVTGGGTGIGRAAALAYSSEGAKAVVAGRRSSEIDETVRLIGANDGVGCAVPTDVAVAQQVRELVDVTVERYGCLDAAFNNAGIKGTFAPITDLSEADFDEVIAINLRGGWLSIKYEVAAMLSLGNGGSIVNTSSFLAKGASVGSTAYSASKGGLDALIRAVAIEYGRIWRAHRRRGSHRPSLTGQPLSAATTAIFGCVTLPIRQLRRPNFLLILSRYATYQHPAPARATNA